MWIHLLPVDCWQIQPAVMPLSTVFLLGARALERAVQVLTFHPTVEGGAGAPDHTVFRTLPKRIWHLQTL